MTQLCVGQPVARVQVFGSVARGCAGVDSDVDLLVDFLPDTSFADELEFAAKAEDALGVPVDVVRPDEVLAQPNPFKRRNILTHAILVYER
jgi:predicted nucleotidyltransferase